MKQRGQAGSHTAELAIGDAVNRAVAATAEDVAFVRAQDEVCPAVARCERRWRIRARRQLRRDLLDHRPSGDWTIWSHHIGWIQKVQLPPYRRARSIVKAAHGEQDGIKSRADIRQLRSLDEGHGGAALGAAGRVHGCVINRRRSRRDDLREGTSDHELAPDIPDGICRTRETRGQ